MNLIYKRCPHCGEALGYVDYTAAYTERYWHYGNVRGTYDFECYDVEDQTETGIDDESFDFEGDNHYYTCPICQREITDPDGLENCEDPNPPEMKDPEEEQPKTAAAKKLINSFKEYEQIQKR